MTLLSNHNQLFKMPPTSSPLRRRNLEKMSKSQIQNIAKMARVNYSTTKEVMIELLLEKYPTGVPTAVTPPPKRRAAARRPITSNDTDDLRRTPDSLFSRDSSPSDDGHTGSGSSRSVSPPRAADRPTLEELTNLTNDLQKLRSSRDGLTSRMHEVSHLLSHACKNMSKRIDPQVYELQKCRMDIQSIFLDYWKEDKLLWNGVGLLEGDEGAEERAVWREWMESGERENPRAFVAYQQKNEAAKAKNSSNLYDLLSSHGFKVARSDLQ